MSCYLIICRKCKSLLNCAFCNKLKLVLHLIELGVAMDCETTVFSSKEHNGSIKKHGLEWNRRYFITWLRIICLYPLNANASKVANGIALIIRFGLWVVNLVAHILQLFLFYKLGYETASSTEYWNAVIDYWNWTAHNLAVHCLIFFIELRQNNWMQLNKLLVKNDNAMQHYDSKTSLRLKNRSIWAIVYIVVAVRHQFNPFSNVLLNIKANIVV